MGSNFHPVPLRLKITVHWRDIESLKLLNVSNQYTESDFHTRVTPQTDSPSEEASGHEREGQDQPLRDASSCSPQK